MKKTTLKMNKPKLSQKLDRRAFLIALILGIALNIFFHIGYAADKTYELMVGRPGWWMTMMIMWIPFVIIIYLLIVCAHKIGTERKSDIKSYFFQIWGIVFACWVPVFLAEYPGFFVYDATDEYVEVATRCFTTHHPLLHVLMVGGSVCAGHKITGDYNVGIAVYIIFQMLLVSAIFAWMIDTSGFGRKGRILSVIWYGLFPTVVMFALCSVKDTLFAAFMLVAVVIATRLLNGSGLKDVIVLGISLVLMMLMRRNGVYAFAVFAICMVLAYVIKRKMKYAIWAMLTAWLIFGSYKVVDKGLELSTRAENIENQEILTVPIQQLARTWSAYKDQMSQEDLELLYSVIPEEALNHYTPNLSDPVKAEFDNAAYVQNKNEFLKLWWKLLTEHPLSYINAWIDTSYGYYYPPVIVNVYAGHEMYTIKYTESSYFGYEVEHPGVRRSLIPFIDDIYRWISLDDDIQKIPVVSWLFSMGALAWFYLICFGVLIYQRKYNELTAFSLPAATWMTLILGPTFLPRYTVFLWFLLPYLISTVCNKIRSVSTDETYID